MGDRWGTADRLADSLWCLRSDTGSIGRAFVVAGTALPTVGPLAAVELAATRGLTAARETVFVRALSALTSAALELAADPARIAEIEKNVAPLARLDAAGTIAEEIYKLV